MRNQKSFINVYAVLVPEHGRPDRQSNNTTVGIDNETSAIFSSFKKATAFKEVVCKYLFDYYQADDDPEGCYPYVFQIQILEIVMPEKAITETDTIESMVNMELVKHCWCYDVKGKLLWQLPVPTQGQSNFERYAYEGRFTIGDLVYVVPQGKDPDSESVCGDYAVVSNVPIAKEQWVHSGNRPEVWDPFYTVDYVNGYGYLDHYHVPESSLSIPVATLTDELAFLPIWATFLQGEVAFPEGLPERIRAQQVHLLKIPRYDLTSITKT